MNKNQERSIFFAILCCCCLTVIVILLISIPAGYYIYETYFICMGEPPATPGLLSDWDGYKRYSGLVVKYRCNLENHHEVVQIVDCVGGEWKIVMKKSGLCAASPHAANPLTCQDDPPQFPGMTRIWDGYSRAIGSSVEYRCKKDPEQDRAVIMVCTEFVWKTTYKKDESCEHLLQIRRCTSEPWQSPERLPSDWDNKTRDVGTQIRIFCNNAPHSPVMRTVMCSRDYHWHLLTDTKENCLCGQPIYYPLPIQYDWDRKTLATGLEVNYWCSTNMEKVIFMSIKCSSSASWIVTKSGTCTYLIDRPMNFTDANNYCSNMDSTMTIPNNETELEGLKTMLKEEKTFDSACNHKAFVGIRENPSMQWVVDREHEPTHYVSAYSSMWHTLDEGREHCAAMQRSVHWELNNVLCNGGIRYCSICEVNDTNKHPMRVCLPSQKTCFLAVSGSKGDYAFHKKFCENIGGHVAAPVSRNILDEVVKAVKMNVTYENACDFSYVALISKKRYYETVEGTEVSFQPFEHDRVRSMARHCAVIHEKNQYKYVDEHCQLNTCFMCTISGPPLGTVIKGHVNKLKDSGLDVKLQARHMQSSVGCKQDWISDGFGCFLFNSTQVTERVARATCRHHFADLASLSIPIDRQFISHHLIRHFSGTDNLLWHVEMSGDLEDAEDLAMEVDFDANCTVVHLLPQFGWSFMDCTTKAAFICHD